MTTVIQQHNLRIGEGNYILDVARNSFFLIILNQSI